MATEPIPSLPAGNPPELPPKPGSLIARLFNVYAAPGEALDDVVGQPVNTWNWVLPALASCIAIVIFSVVAFSQEAIVREVKENAAHAIDVQVAQGKVPQAQAETSKAAVDRFLSPALLAAFGSVGGVIGIAIALFGVAFANWAAAKVLFKTSIDFVKVLELVGLTMMTIPLQTIVKTFLVVWKGSIAVGLGPSMFIESPSMTNKAHMALANVDVLDFWWFALVGLAVSRATGLKFWKPFTVTLLVTYVLKFFSVLTMK